MHKKNFLFILIFASIVNGEFYINEVMYNPESNDNNMEYVEIYSDLNLSGFTIEDFISSDVLEPVKYVNSSFSLIVEEGFDYGNIEANIYSIGATIGNNLNNDKDIIIIKDNDSEVLDVFSYTDNFGGNNNGFSLCRVPDKFGIFKECAPTPGKENNVNVNFDLRINEILPNPEGDDDATMPNGEWIEIHNFGKTDVDLEGFEIRDDFGHKLFISNSHVLGGTTIAKDGYIVVYANGAFGLLNNDNFEKITLLDDQGNIIDSVSYDSSQEGVSWALIEDKWHKSNPTTGRENPKEIDGVELDSKIKIENIYLGEDGKAKWGDNLRIRLSIYKGNTSKEEVQAWFYNDEEVVSKRTSFNILRRFEEQEITIPIQVHPNCKDRYEDGKYNLIVTGLDAEAREKIEITGLNSELCEQSGISKNREFTYEVIDIPSEVFVGETFDTIIKITNNLGVKKRFMIWNEIKDDKRRVSSKGNANDAQEVEIPGGLSANLKFKNIVVDAPDGKYKLSLKILPEERKRPVDISSGIEVKRKDSNFVSETNLNEEEGEKNTEGAVYESKTVKQRKLAFYLFMLVIGFIAIYGFIRKNDQGQNY